MNFLADYISSPRFVIPFLILALCVVVLIVQNGWKGVAWVLTIFMGVMIGVLATELAGPVIGFGVFILLAVLMRSISARWGWFKH